MGLSSDDMAFFDGQSDNQYQDCENYHQMADMLTFRFWRGVFNPALYWENKYHSITFRKEQRQHKFRFMGHCAM